MMSSSPKIAVIDYRLGNMFSVAKAIEIAGGSPQFVSHPKAFSDADALVLPGVGAFGDGMKNLQDQGLAELVCEQFHRGLPIMGICLGMQLAFSGSTEFGNHKGLGLIEGSVIGLPQNHYDLLDRPLKVPHIGWNKVTFYPNRSNLFWDTSDELNGRFFYFVHSYHANPKFEKNILSQTNFGETKFCSSVIERNFIGFQFHPEKSGQAGIEIYKKWISNVRKARQS